ncbi:MAG TPA: hypothetical protein VM870_00715, partial [Pyrinomonadaceae bacterium]|nr:hypothetical protein [Pyrinomonadaceae bacterium]
MIEEMLLPQKKKTTAAGGGANPTTIPIPQTPARDAPSPQPSNQLHSIFALARNSNFTGTFNARGTDYTFTY